MKLTSAGEKELSARDLGVYANFTAIRAILQPKLKENRQKILDDVDRNMGKNPQAEKMVPFFHALANQGLNVADSFLRDAQAATFGITIGDEGLNYSVMADFTPGSYCGQTVQAMKTSDDVMLNGLPAGKYLFFGGWVQDPEASAKLIGDLIDPVVKELVAQSPDNASLADYFAQIKTVFSNLKGGSFGLFAPTGALGQESLIQEGGVLNGNATAIMSAQQKIGELAPQAFKAIGMPADTFKFTYTPKAKTINGVTFDSIVTNVTPDPNNPAAAQQEQMVKLMYGPNGMTQLIGANGDHLLFGVGLSDAQLSTVIDVAKTNDAPLAALEQVKKVAGQLPAKHAFEGFCPLDQVVTTGLTYAKQFGFAVPVQLPADLPPIGVAVSTDSATIHYDAYVPTALIQSLVAAGMQAAMQMNGGGGGGGGGM
ncbi:MAG: hypothetical protein JO353_04655 [Phycisphaerae bacterium]|nr:hypothetical protein [Phycisphaerae bacterium]